MHSAVYFFIDAPWWILAVALFFGAAFAAALVRPVRFPTVVTSGLVSLAGGVGLLVGAAIDSKIGSGPEHLILMPVAQGAIVGYLAGLAVLVRSKWLTSSNRVMVLPPADPSAGETISDVLHTAPSRQPGTPGYSFGECLAAVGLSWWTAGSVLIWVCGAASGALFGSKLSVLDIVTHNFRNGLFSTKSYEFTLRTPAAIVGGEVTCAAALLMLCSLGPWRDGFLEATLRFRTRLGWDRRHRAAPRFNLVPLAAIPIGLFCLIVGVYLGVNFVSAPRLTPGERLLKSALVGSGVFFLGLSCLATNLALLRNERWSGLTALGLCLNAFPILVLVAGLESFEGIAAVVGCLSGSLFIWLVVRWVNRRANGSHAF